MKIESSIIDIYLSGNNIEKIGKHWIFSNIEENQYLFEMPDLNKRNKVKEIYKVFNEVISTFEPLNKKIFKMLFPNYKELFKEIQVILIVGSPNPYDAMFLERKGIHYIILDLIRFSDYVDRSISIKEVLSTIITHEFTHQCISQDFKQKESKNYLETLNYIAFNEGLAHLLAFKDNIEQVKWSVYDESYTNSKIFLLEASKEMDTLKQNEYLIKADSGKYWEKFASISGKIYLGKNLKKIEKIYCEGDKDFINKILEI